MTDYVVDSSVAVKWILPESDSRIAKQFASDIDSAGGRLLVLDLAVLEIANAIWKQYHRRLISDADSRQFLRGVPLLPVAVYAANPLLVAACDIAWKYDLVVYDSLFVALTQHLQLPGITADEPLWNAVKTDFPNIILLRDWPVPTP